ncbi:MAG: ABC transporter ATP-binding protein [Dechloromonas sp.]|nr:ABC transporter ATP-binding protein [Dechloromonas sp.]
MSAPLLEARSLCVAVAGRTLVQGLDLALGAGECLAILGRNGAGKSTLLSTLAGLRPPRSGEVLLGGESTTRLPPRAAALRRAWLGQQRGDPFATTVLETALTGRHPHLGRWDWESEADAQLARAALAEVDLAGLESRGVDTLSGGERQRLAIATLLTQAAPLYLLDEPLSHLDLCHQVAILGLFKGLARARGVGVVMVLHDPGLAYRYCQRALLLYGEGEAECGPVADMLTAHGLTRLYRQPLRCADLGGGRVFVPEEAGAVSGYPDACLSERRG